MIERCVFKTPWGWMGLAGSIRGVRIIALPKTSRRSVEGALDAQWASMNGSPAAKGSHVQLSASPSPLLKEAQAQLLSFMAGERSTLDFPIDLSGGSSFQRRVWRAILRIPYGRVRSYKWVAARVGGQRYARAVGNAVGANPVPVIIPCHRVVAHDGSLGGFSGGLRTKRRLLALEGSLAQLKARPRVTRRGG
ncbi:MAG: methylated-DNA--[protein]-cysteine S-methyltransferase [Nitrospiraceae bacterium]